MYTDNYPYLTFEDLVHATQQSAGLGQTNAIQYFNIPNCAQYDSSGNCLTYENTAPVVVSPQTGSSITSLDPSLSSVLQIQGTSWQTLALVAGAVLAGVFVLKGVSR